jgi:hypothetical protein
MRCRDEFSHAYAEEVDLGAWGSGSFENDNAVDWTYGLKGKSDLSYIEATLDRVLGSGTNYLEAPDAEEAIAAAEAVARLQGKFGSRDAYTQSIDDWVSGISIKPPPQLIEKARQVLIRVLQEPSELLELWSESADAKAWKESVAALGSRLVPD